MSEIKLFRPFSKNLLAVVTDRYDGVSQAPYESLNLALHVGDKPLNVLQNRLKIAQKYHYIGENLIYMDQTHSDHVAVVRDCAHNKLDDTDAAMTDQKNIPLMVMVADCVPILFYDPKKHVIAVAHAGRNGTFKEIAKKTALKMGETYGCDMSDLLVYLGPSIGQCCYEVGDEIAQIVRNSFGESYMKGGIWILK